MSSRAIAWALDASCSGPMSAEARVVLAVLGDYASSDGSGAWPSAATIAKRLAITDRAVRRALRTLEESCAIVRGDQEMASDIRADRRPVVWDLPIDGVTEPSGRTRTVGREGSARGDADGQHGVTEPSYKPRTQPTTQTPPSPSKVTSPETRTVDPHDWSGRRAMYISLCPDCDSAGHVAVDDSTVKKCTHPSIERTTA